MAVSFTGILAAGGLDAPDVPLWDVRTGEGLAPLHGHREGIGALAFTSDGKTLVSTSSDGSVKLWDTEKRRHLATLAGHTGEVLTAAFSPDGTILATGGADTTVRLWDVAAATETNVLGRHGTRARAVAFSPDSRFVASGADDGTIRLWDLTGGRTAHLDTQRRSAVNTLAFSPADTILASGFADGTIALWNTATQQEVTSVKRNRAAVTALTFSPDGSTLASASFDDLVHFWDVRQRENVVTLRWARSFQPHFVQTYALSYAPGGRLFATAAAELGIRLWDADTLVERRRFVGHGDFVRSAAFSPDGRTLATASSDHTARLWDVATGKERFRLDGHAAAVWAVGFFPDGRTVATSSDDQTVKIWDVATGQERATLSAPGAALHALAVAPNGRMLVAAGDDGAVRLWRAASDADLAKELAPETPADLQPAPATGHASALVLRATPFVHPYPSEVHHTSHWQVRAANASYDLPLLDERHRGQLTALTIPHGLLPPRKDYYWRVAYTGSNGRTSTYSPETPFASGDFSWEAVPVDLTAHFSHDVVANFGDDHDDRFDGVGCLLLEDGFDGKRTDNPQANGLPRDKRIGVHTLGDYNGANVIQTRAGGRDAIRIPVPSGRYAFVRFLVAGGNGDTRMPLQLQYAGGFTQQRILPCDDWYDKNRSQMQAARRLHRGAIPVTTGLDRLCGAGFDDANDPSLFEVAVAVDGEREFIGFVLRPEQAYYQKGGETRFNLFAVTAIRTTP